MAIPLRQSTASQEVPLGYFLDSADGNTEETGLTIANTDIKLWKTGATTLANKNIGGATHISNGIYYTVLDDTDTNTLGPLVIFVHVSGALAVRLECLVLAANIYDSLIAASDSLQVETTAIANDAITAAAIAAGAVTEIQTGLSTLSQADIRTAVGLAAANLDTQLSTIDDFLDTEVAAIKAKTDQLTFTVAGRLDTNVILIEGVDATDQLAVIASGAGSGTAIEFTYTVTNSLTGVPIQGARVWVTTDVAGANVVWSGNTDTFGVARDDSNQKPMLDAGTYYFWRQKSTFTFVNPDTEVVS